MPDNHPRLQQKYRQDVVPQLMKQYGFRNVLEVPRLMKVSLNMGLGDAVQTPKIIDTATEEMASSVASTAVASTATASLPT